MRDEAKQFQEINGLVIEYLSFHGFIDTLNAFDQELRRLMNERPGSASLLVPNQNTRQLSETQKQNNREEMMSCLKQGNMSTYFGMWEKYVSAKLRSSDEETIRLEFFCRLYAATLALRNGANDMKSHKKNIEEFKNYINRKGNLINSPELLPFYAFPYIPDPSTHPSFIPLFQKQWRDTLFSQVSEFLQRTFAQPQKAPVLHSMVLGNVVPRASSASSGSDKNYEKSKREFASHINYVQDKYRELYAVSSDLLRALGGVVKGKKLNIEFLKCAKEKIDVLNYETLLPTTTVRSDINL
jgi:hypothetical protein